MARERLVVIGGDAAGMSAASQARKRRDPADLQIVAFEKGRATSYSACGIPYWISGAVAREDNLIARSPARHRDNGIDVRTRTEVTAIDLAARTVRARDLDDHGREYDEPFDTLVYATGSVPLRPPIAGIDATGVYGVQTLDDGAALRAELDSERVRRVVVVGGGYIGLEIAEACRVRDLDVTVVDRSPTLVGTIDPDIGVFLGDAVRAMGIALVHSEAVVGIETGHDGRATAVHTDAERRLPADLVVLGLGVRPDIDLAQRAGIPLGTSGGIAVDARMRTQVDGVWAAGDCVESVHRLSGQRVVVALGTHANKQGRVIGVNIGGGYATFPGVIGTAVTKVCELEVARTGLSAAEADIAGYRYVTASVDSTTRAGYFPGARPIRIKMLAEKRTGRLLGAQIVGREGAAKRIDVLATAIWNEMGVDEILGLDLSYAPPFAPVWDPVLIAARKAFDAVEADTHT
ncbi:FAD-dependent oxidoreductase [Rhodococcus jostii]|uniref:NADPH-dependent 2,4-dienoyl-CoA reductase, sulfur reductase n=1 Tax=Rhodococcus jostii TaxID=132919 RepID=A0A1H5MCE5_RHOJO|nr:FAD-dependent oxidoreductase [Rhodococcus jostii]SEE86427.1 NADPH-dependent 2,4-dienoyl-CoA reductase, sulfur reductase [Rhodococcus jostii]